MVSSQDQVIHLVKMLSLSYSAVATLLLSTAVAEKFDPLQHLGGQGPWFPGKLDAPQALNISLTQIAPNPNDISSEPPAGCSVDTAAFLSRHGSRYPDPGAYNGWLSIYYKVFILAPN